MQLLKVGAATLNQTPLDWQNNKAHILEAIEDAKNQSISVLCLPELCITGYGCEDAFYAADTSDRALKILLEIAENTHDLVVCVGLPIKHHHKTYNAVALVADRKILGFVCKMHLPNYGLFYEDRWFQRWPQGLQSEIEIQHMKYPIGDLTFDLSGVRIGFEICEDGWVANRPGRVQFDRGVDIILNPSASPFAFRKFETRERLVQEGSRAFSCTYIYTNLLGNEAGRLIFDGDAMIAQSGNLLVSSPRFGYANHYLISAVIDIDLPRIGQSQIKSIPPVGNWKVSTLFDFPTNLTPQKYVAELEAFEKGGYLKEEEFARSVSLALFDYLRKSRSQGFTISLSGGADSCACVALCGLMLRLAEESIGIDGLKRKLHHIQKIQDLSSLDALTHELVHAMYQGTENSSKDTLESAESLATDMGAQFMNININGLVEAYKTLIENQLQRELSWQTDDLALQNIQARVRAPGIWLMTNLANHLLLATSNRSEVAVGYCTMDGDTAGSINPISGIDKFWLKQWLVWLEKIGCHVKNKHIKIKGLAKVNSLAPTAELRPLEAKQTDEADLMPYDVLNAIEEAAIRDHNKPFDVYKIISASYKDVYSLAQIELWVERFFRLWSRNQWKRERFAPGFHVDDRNLDPRSWCRFPILSGGFEQELQEMKSEIKTGGTPSTKKIGF